MVLFMNTINSLDDLICDLQNTNDGAIGYAAGEVSEEVLAEGVKKGLIKWESSEDGILVDLILPMEEAAPAPPSFVPQEVAYRIQNVRGTATWKRKIVKTEKAFAKLIEKLQEQDAEIQTRDADV
jgi:hypothetical protein